MLLMLGTVFIFHFCSTLRQVPDYQEVFVADDNSFSIIFELLDQLAEDSLSKSLLYME